jgi:hypothetical protein
MLLGKTPCRRQRRQSPQQRLDSPYAAGSRAAGADLIALGRPDCSVPVLRR